MVRQKLGMISEINYFQNWIYQKKCLTKVGVLNWYSSLKSFLERFRQFLTLKINFQIPILVFFDEQIHQQNFLNFFPLSMLILWIRVKHALTRPRTPSHALTRPQPPQPQNHTPSLGYRTPWWATKCTTRFKPLPPPIELRVCFTPPRSKTHPQAKKSPSHTLSRLWYPLGGCQVYTKLQNFTSTKYRSKPECIVHCISLKISFFVFLTPYILLQASKL